MEHPSPRLTRSSAGLHGTTVDGEHIVVREPTDVMLVRVADSMPGAYRAIPPELIEEADAETETVFLGIAADEVAVLPEPDFFS